MKKNRNFVLSLVFGTIPIELLRFATLKMILPLNRFRFTLLQKNVFYHHIPFGMGWLNVSAPGCKPCSPGFESGISPTHITLSRQYYIAVPKGFCKLFSAPLTKIKILCSFMINLKDSFQILYRQIPLRFNTPFKLSFYIRVLWFF